MKTPLRKKINASLTLESLNLKVDVKLYRYSRETASRAPEDHAGVISIGVHH